MLSTDRQTNKQTDRQTNGDQRYQAKHNLFCQGTVTGKNKITSNEIGC